MNFSLSFRYHGLASRKESRPLVKSLRRREHDATCLRNDHVVDDERNGWVHPFAELAFVAMSGSPGVRAASSAGRDEEAH